MNFFLAFLFSGLVCVVAEIILDNTKLTPGHITSIFTVGGAVLSFFGIYEKLIKIFGAGATVLISNFGHNLYMGAMEGFQSEGILGLFTGILTKSSAAISGAIIFAFTITLLFKAKN